MTFNQIYVMTSKTITDTPIPFAATAPSDLPVGVDAHGIVDFKKILCSCLCLLMGDQLS